ncbi:methylated-DNA--[protein]-cysteine S-methyltransferase [Limnobacter parvus]|uniref:Methylated-DNA--[protein]-cysteine S-methyltransferase n=1 Tax=Limnobacter parvus TaxID=2939690 RepID=A0ABT1XK74_9BURK|nr:methylated-DNA--[protein]-cysteine S-methyltransferase [Limnobacter parvus]MCR2747696.1 methylated-DNA--[protein]-cysteine S-methyltransferase [Limnobacter parvus]
MLYSDIFRKKQIAAIRRKKHTDNLNNYQNIDLNTSRPHAHYQLVETAIHLLERRSLSKNISASSNEPSLAELAKLMGMSPSHLQRVFKEWAGISPKQFFQCLQKDHARKLLLAGNSSLNTTMEMGYPSSSKLHQLMVKFEALTPGEIKRQGEGITFRIGRGSSPFGEVFVCLTSKGINSLEFQTESLGYLEWLKGLSQIYPKAQFQESDREVQTIIDITFHEIEMPTGALSLQVHGTAFQLQVWQALLHLPHGQLTSYQQLANAIGKPSASRAVGSAVAKNPIAFLIPCHRVIKATGDLGQYRWNSERKKALHIWEQGLKLR